MTSFAPQASTRKLTRSEKHSSPIPSIALPESVPPVQSSRTGRFVSCLIPNPADLLVALHASPPSPDTEDDSHPSLSAMPLDILLSTSHTAPVHQECVVNAHKQKRRNVRFFFFISRTFPNFLAEREGFEPPDP